MTHPAFSNGGDRWLPGYCVRSESSKRIVMIFNDELAPTCLQMLCQDLGSQYCTGQVLSYQQSYAPVVSGPAALRYSVDFPFIPPQNTGLVCTTLQEDSMYNCSDYAANPCQDISDNRGRVHLLLQECLLGSSRDVTCLKCKRERREHLTREVRDLVSKHGCLEVAGKELLGWYMMLSEDDRKIIKESGHLTEFLQDDTTLLVDNNWVMLKDGNMADSAADAHLLNKSGRAVFFCENCSGYSFKVSTCTRCHTAINELEESTLSSDCELELKNMDATGLSECEAFNRIPMYNEEQCGTDSVGVYHEGKLSNKVVEQHSGLTSLIKNRVSKVIPEDITHYGSTKDTWEQMFQVDASTESVFAGKSSDLTLEHLEGKSFHSPGKQVFRKSPVNQGDLSSFEDSGISGDQMCASSDWLLENRKYVKAGEPGENHSMPGQKWDRGLCEEPVNQHTSSDLLDDTFFSIRSGSCCSLFSSYCSLDDQVDTEECYFEDAIKDLHWDPLNNQSNQPQKSLCTSADIQQYNTTIYPSVEPRHRMISKAVNTDETILEMPVLGKSKAKLTRDSACNTDMSLLSEFRHEKESQTIKVDTEDISIITDISVPKYLPLPLVIVNSEVYESHKEEACKALGEDPQPQSINSVTPNDGISEPLGKKEPPEKKPDNRLTFKALFVLAELEAKYEKMKELILSGDTLNPLSMQVRLSNNDPITSPDCRHTPYTPLHTFPQGSSGQESPSSLMDSPHHINQKESRDLRVDHIKDPTYFCLPAQTKDEPVEREPERSEFLPGKSTDYYVCVRNIANSITEAELIFHFQKYGVSIVVFQELCQKSSYAILKFGTLEHAQAAVLEMNGKELCGRALKVNYIKDSKQSAYEKLDHLSGSQPHNTTQSASVESTDTAFPLSSKKRGSVPTERAVTLLGAPMYPAHMPPPVPSWGSPSYVPLMPPWMVCNSMRNQGTIPYPGPPYLLPTTSQAPWCAPSFPQSPSVIAKPGTIRYKSSQVTNVKSSSAFSFARDGSVPSCTTKPKFVSDGISLGLSSAGLFGSEQANSMLPSTKSKMHHETNATAVRGTSKVAIVSTAATPVASFSAPSNIQISQSAMITAATDTLKASTTPVIRVTTAKVQNPKTAEAGEGEPCTAAVPSKHLTTPLRAPTSFPPTVTIPQQIGNKSSGDFTSVFRASSAKTSVVIPSASPSSKAQPECPASYTGDSERGGWGICPQLDPFTEYPMFIIPNRFNLSVGKRVMNELTSRYPDLPCDQIAKALKDIQKERGGYLSGLSIEAIVSMASSILAAETLPSKKTK